MEANLLFGELQTGGRYHNVKNSAELAVSNKLALAPGLRLQSSHDLVSVTTFFANILVMDEILGVIANYSYIWV